MTATAHVRSSVGKSHSTSLPAATAPRLTLTPASAGDHSAIYHLLLAIQQGPSAAEFQAQLEEPLYEPNQRLVVKLGAHLIGHAHATQRAFHFGALRLLAGEVKDLTVLPEFRGRGLGSSLLAAAERELLADGAQVALLRTTSPAFFLKRGWTSAVRHVSSTASIRPLLSQLHVEAEQNGTGAGLYAKESLNIRLWRHVEQEPLMRLYASSISGAYGAWERSESYWRWLITRHGYERLYVAIAGPDRLELTDTRSPLVGYAATVRNRIAELHAPADRPSVARQLIDRIGHDAIERNDSSLRYDGPPNDPLHALFTAAGGQHLGQESDETGVLLMKVLDLRGLLTRLAPLLHERAKAAGVETPCDLGLELPSGRLALHVSQRSVRVVSARAIRSRLSGHAGAIARLVLGRSTAEELVATGQLTASTRQALNLATALFPRVPLWFPTLDELPG